MDDKNQFKILIFLIAIAFFSCSQKTSEKEDKEPLESTIQKQSGDLVRTMIDELMKSSNTPPGMSIAIGINNKVVYAEGFGYSNLKTKKHVTTQTQFRAASVSKMMTVTALAKLIQEEKLSLDDTVYEYVPKFPKKEYPFTIRQLTGHIAGIPHYSSADSINDNFYGSVDDALKVFAHIDLVNQPGTQYHYSTHGYTLLSAVIEGATGQSFLNYISQNIFNPLSMGSTGPDIRTEPSKEMTELYGFHQSGINSGLPTKIINPEDPSYKWAGGGMISTPTDLVKLSNSYLNGFINSELVEKLFESQNLISGEKTGIGIGWRQNWDMDGREIFEHAGAMGGARSVVSIFPEKQLTISIMANSLRIWGIEETGHMLALPFLTKASPKVQPNGIAEIILSSEVDGKEVNKKGLLILDTENDRLVIEPNTADTEIYPLVYLQRDNIYSLVHPLGLLYTTIDFEGDTISGKSFYYRSPQLTMPDKDLPMFKFHGSFTE